MLGHGSSQKREQKSNKAPWNIGCLCWSYSTVERVGTNSRESGIDSSGLSTSNEQSPINSQRDVPLVICSPLYPVIMILARSLQTRLCWTDGNHSLVFAVAMKVEWIIITFPPEIFRLPSQVLFNTHSLKVMLWTPSKKITPVFQEQNSRSSFLRSLNRTSVRSSPNEMFSNLHWWKVQAVVVFTIITICSASDTTGSAVTFTASSNKIPLPEM